MLCGTLYHTFISPGLVQLLLLLVQENVTARIDVRKVDMCLKTTNVSFVLCRL